MVAPLIGQYGRSLVTEAARSIIDDIRNAISNLAEEAIPLLSDENIFATLESYLSQVGGHSLRKVFNLTGTVLHTNLGRAMLADEAIEAMMEVASGFSNLEYDLKTGKRGDRDVHLEDLLCKLTGAEAATVVNNNAAAVLLVLNALGLRKEVLVSRGELIEIGGAFRIPDIMTRAGCKLVEVGTTNRTHESDFENAINTKTACLMKVHTSNYVIQGFTQDVSAEQMAKIAHSRDLPVIEDLGSGSLLDLSKFNLPKEPMVSESIASGVDIVMFSGDKLLGGPQSGLIVGDKKLISKIKKNPMKRAMRLDKITIAALSSTLRLYLDPDKIRSKIPTLRLLSRDLEEVKITAEAIKNKLTSILNNDVIIDQIDCLSQIGSGSLPVNRLPSAAIVLRPKNTKKSGRILQLYAEAFRALPIPVIGRINDGAFIMDMRCLEDVSAFTSQLGELEL
jgi:L-seryl-tRNA(Ser) seleniumtransferase|tara:strand:+ start:765 stop:2114 length:1350 start_codon:yes stop_codon:yes gene_type:complete